MKLIHFVPFFEAFINELKSSTDENAKFRLKNYIKWLKLLEESKDDDINIENSNDINELNIPEKMKIKMIEILEKESINGIKIPNDYKRIENTNARENTNERENDVITNTLQSASTTIKIIKHPKKVDLIDFYGFGPASKNTFEAEGITGEHLLTEWDKYIKLNPLNQILLSSLRERPNYIPISTWNTFSDEQKHEKIKSKMMDDISKNTIYLCKLNYHQLVGVKHYYNIMEKIPRVEIEKFEKLLRKILKRMNPGLKMTICGSYRRGRAESGDIDCFITHPDIVSKDNTQLLNDIVKVLTKCGILVDHLTEYGGTKYMGMGKLLEIPRRIDIRVIPWASYPYAILYFTGSKNHNLIMRNIAKKKGYKLNEYSMEFIIDHSLVQCNTEEEIFKVLGMEYLDPTQRDI